MTDRDGEVTSLAVPKFSSFRSKEPKEPKPEPKPEPRPERHRESRRKRDHGDRASYEHRRKERRSRSRDRSRLSGVPGLFVIDTQGDPLITKYGGIDKSQIPVYRCHGGGRVLGTAGRLVLHRDSARDQFSLRMPGQRPAFSSGLRSLRPTVVANPVTIRARKSGSARNADEVDGYLPLSSSKRKNGQSDDSTDEDEIPSYRSIEARSKQNATGEPDSDSEASMDATVSVHPLKRKSMQLSQHVKDHPGDIDAWLELVDHQDALLKFGEVDHAILENEAHSFAEIKVSMLEKALANTTNPQDRTRVLVRLMREGAKVWAGKTTEKKWTEVLKDENEDFALWKTHLDFSMSNMTTFRYDDVKTVLSDRLRCSLSRAALSEAIHVFLTATRFIHDAGYKELAVAAWQGLLELNLFRPPGMSSEQAALEAFRDFWESEVLRVGEAGAKGWRHYHESGEGDAPEPAMHGSAEPSSGGDCYKVWGTLERQRAQGARMPARTMDEGMQDDLFGVVMFADIAPFLFSIPDAALPEVREQLLDAFLLFCGLEPAFRSSPWTETALEDQFIASALTDIDLEAAGDEGDPSTRRGLLGRRNVRAAASSAILFGGARWFHYAVSQENALVDMSWVSETLRQLVHAAGVEGLALYHLAVRFATEPATVKKAARALLKRYPTRYDVYNGYALAEFANGEPDVADNVFASTAAASEKGHRFLLFKSWGWIGLEMGKKSTATARLCSSVDGVLLSGEVGRATILKARQAFTSEFDEALATGELEAASTLAECLMLLSYLTAEGNTEPSSSAQGNISSAMSVAEALSRDFSMRGLTFSAAHERSLQFAAQLLYSNASKGPFRRAYMRQHLARFITTFPRNTIFLSLFEWADTGLRVVDETRDCVHEKALVKPHDCVSSRVFAVEHELAHGNANTARRAFEQAVTSDAGRNSAMLWTRYVRFCSSHEAWRDKAKEVYYRALRQCPGSKEVTMEAFGMGGMEEGELRAIYESMTMKGLRVHVDLEVLERGGSRG